MADYITVVEVDDPSSKDTNQQRPHLVSRKSSIPEDSSFITVLSINNNPHLINRERNEAVAQQSADTNQNLIVEPETVIVYRLPGG